MTVPFFPVIIFSVIFLPTATDNGTFFFQVVISGGSDLTGTLRPKKKRTVVWLAIFQRVQITTGKNYNWKKNKVQSSRLTGHFFRRVQIKTYFPPEPKTDKTAQLEMKKVSSSPCEASVFDSLSVFLSMSKG